MIPALQAILIPPDPEERLNITLGKIKIIFLDDHHDYHPGIVVFFSHILNWHVMATITSVRLTTLAGVSGSELEAGGLSRQKLLDILRKTNHGATLFSPVTVVRWDNVESG